MYGFFAQRNWLRTVLVGCQISYAEIIRCQKALKFYGKVMMVRSEIFDNLHHGRFCKHSGNSPKKLIVTQTNSTCTDSFLSPVLYPHICPKEGSDDYQIADPIDPTRRTNWMIGRKINEKLSNRRRKRWLRKMDGCKDNFVIMRGRGIWIECGKKPAGSARVTVVIKCGIRIVGIRERLPLHSCNVNRARCCHEYEVVVKLMPRSIKWEPSTQEGT